MFFENLPGKDLYFSIFCFTEDMLNDWQVVTEVRLQNM